jgi:hypothetical protein
MLREFHKAHKMAKGWDFDDEDAKGRIFGFACVGGIWLILGSFAFSVEFVRATENSQRCVKRQKGGILE